MSEKKRILVVEDDAALLPMISYNLQKNGFSVKEATNGEEALLLVKEEIPSLAIIDWMIPAPSGLEVCRILRRKKETSSIPIIILSAKGEEEDKIRGLDTGADDYITKPFSQRLLLERIKTLLRRQKLNSDDPENECRSGIMRGHLQLDSARHLCKWKQSELNLTVTEFLLIETLAKRPGLVKTRDQLIDAAYGETIYVDDRTIDSHIKRLRRKFKSFDENFDEIETIYGIGYRYKNIKEKLET